MPIPLESAGVPYQTHTHKRQINVILHKIHRLQKLIYKMHTTFVFVITP